MSKTATRPSREETPRREARGSSTATIISASLPPNKIGETGNLWSRLLHAAALPIIVGLAILGLEGQFSMSVFKEAWPVMAVLVTAYVCAWRLSSEFERFPFINQFEAALVSVSITLVPAGLVLYSTPVSPIRNLALVSSAGCIAWYLTDKFLCRYRASRLLLLPGEITRHLNASPVISTMRQENDKKLDGIVADFHTPMNGLQEFLARQSMKGLPVFHAGFIYELLTGRVLLETSSDRSLDISSRRFYPIIRRALDVLLVLASLPVTLPIMLFTSLAIYCESPGSVLFWQERIGKEGRRFEMVKFRSMYLDNEGEKEARYADEDDDRVTKVGRFIRQFRIDELPQFWNILKGEMSLIGPRPEQVRFVNTLQEEISLYAERHSVRPGISGWAQVRQGYAADWDSNRRKLEYDLYYVKHQSFTLDLLIAYLTIKTILTGFGAR